LNNPRRAGAAGVAPEPGSADEFSEPHRVSARGETVLWFARGIGLVAGGLVVLGIAQAAIGAASVLLLVFLAILLASAVRPVVDRVRGLLPVGRPGAILLVYAAFFGAIAGIGLLLVPLLVDQASQLAAQMPAVFDRIKAWSAGLRPHELASSVGGLIASAESLVKAGQAPGAGLLVSAGLTVADIVISIVTVLALLFFWLTEREHLQRFCLSYLPPDRRPGVREGWNIVELRLGAWVRGQLILMIALGTATGLAYSVMGLPAAPLLGLIAGLAEVVPLVGPAIGVAPALLVAAAFRPDLVLVVLIAYVIIQLVESNVLVPIVMRNAVGVSPFLLTVSLLVGAALGGLVGALISVPMVAAAEAIMERLQDRDVPVSQDLASGPASALVAPSDPELTGAT
jgi:predicted PurR-regulated permease PerM